MHNFFLHKNILIFRRFFNSANRFIILFFSSFVVCSLCQAACKGQDIIGYSREVVDQTLTKMMAMSQMFL